MTNAGRQHAEKTGGQPLALRECASCGGGVDHTAYVHIHIEATGVCDYLCLDCYGQVIVWALGGAVGQLAGVDPPE